MFIVIVRFPPVKKGSEAAFEEWFAWSNKEFASVQGFVGRRLLRPVNGGGYVSIVEFETREDFAAMQRGPGHAEAGRRVEPLLDGNPLPEFYEVVTG